MRAIVKAIIRVIIVFWSISLLYSALYNMATEALAFRVGGSSLTFIMVWLVTLLIGVSVLYCLWRSADRIAAAAIDGSDANQVTIGTSNEGLLRVAMVILGFFLLTSFLPKLAGLAASHFMNASIYAGTRYPDDLRVSELGESVAVGVTLLLGIWLVVGNKGIVNGLTYIWNAGHMPADEEDDKS